jgi:hypothetical protein
MTHSPDAGRSQSAPPDWESVWLRVASAAPDRIVEANHERARIERIGNDVARTALGAEFSDDPAVQQLLMQMSLVIPHLPFDRTGFVLAAAAALGRQSDDPELTGTALERLNKDLVRMNLQTAESSFAAASQEAIRRRVAAERSEDMARYRALREGLDEAIAGRSTKGLQGLDKDAIAALQQVGKMRGALTLAERTQANLQKRNRSLDKRIQELTTKHPGNQPRPRPKAVLLRSWQEAERHAADWMRYLGYADAAVTPAGPDGGLDVVADRAIAQVKAEGHLTGSQVIRQLAGLTVGGSHRGKDILFFSTFGYSRDALATAEEIGVALFRFADGGEAVAESTAAKKLLEAAAGPVSTKR